MIFWSFYSQLYFSTKTSSESIILNREKIITVENFQLSFFDSNYNLQKATTTHQKKNIINILSSINVLSHIIMNRAKPQYNIKHQKYV